MRSAVARDRIAVPFFSIITCTYNAGNTLSSCIKSVESQCCADFEHLFIDGFSSDETVPLIKEYEARHPERVRLLQRQPAGVTRAMNDGIAAAKGSVILHLHGDDQMASPDVLRAVKELFDANPATVVVGNCRLEGNPAMKQTWPENRLMRSLYKALIPVLVFHLNPIPHPSTFVAKSVFERRGVFDEKFQVVMDYDFWFRILGKERLLATDKILSIYRFHSDTISSRQMELGLREIDGIHANYRLKYPLRYLLYAGLLRPLLLAGKALRTTKKLTGQRSSPQTLR